MKEDAHWKLNGTRLGPFFGLPEKTIETLKPVGVFAGTTVFSSPLCPKGTIELWRYDERIAAIVGLAKDGDK